jgi:hypothetical protein
LEAWEEGMVSVKVFHACGLFVPTGDAALLGM